MGSSIPLAALASVAAVSIVSLIGIFAFSFRENMLCRRLSVFVSLAAGALIGDAFFHLIPEALENGGGKATAPALIIAGFFFFFVVEKFLHWHHVHGEEVAREDPSLPAGKGRTVIHPTGYLILVSDGLHNLLDGLIIGASYLAGPGVGIATTIAIILHEVPQEIGDFGVLLHTGFSRRRALFLNFLSALLAIVGAALALVLGSASDALVTAILPLAAGGFIYIAAADLVPELHKTKGVHRSLIELAALALGVTAMFLLLFAEADAAIIHDAPPSTVSVVVRR